MKNNEFQAIINISHMDREAVDHFTLSEIMEMYPEVSGIIINDIEYNEEDKVFYAITGLGRVIFPRHLNETLEDIELQFFSTKSLYYNIDSHKVAFKPYRYTFGDRHGYSAKFYTLDDDEYTDTDSDSISRIKDHNKEIINKLYGSSLYGSIERKDAYGNNDPYEECEYTKTPCFEHDCDLCPYNPYQE